MNEELMVPMLEEYAKTREMGLRDRLFEAFFPLAKGVAARFAGRGAEMEDLQQVAGIALLKALERYEPERGYRFATYAVPTITGDLRNFLRDKGSVVRMPRDAREKLYRMRKESELFSQKHLREPTAKELAQAMGIAPDELLMLLQMREQFEVASLDAKVGDEESDFGAFLGRQDEGFKRMEDREWMDWVYSKISDLERELLRFRYEERMGQREAAKRLGVSQMQVSRMERRMLVRLRAIEQSGM